jgi:nucleoside phosphorylase/CheY-like chemotaxis protein
MKVLVVEDDPAKLRRVLDCLNGVGITSDDIEIARDIVSAKRLLKIKSFGLMILDVSLPEDPQSDPVRDAGLKLLDELFEREVYQAPREVVGLTAFDDILANAGARFGEHLWTILRYETSSDAWIEQIQRKIRYIRLAERSQSAQADFGSFLGVITALHTPELTAVLELPWHWEAIERPDDPAAYFKGWFSKGDERRNVYAVAAPRMGMTASAIATTKLIQAFRPRYVAMVGILAGFRGQARIGDIIIADPSWDYGSGKQVSNGAETTFRPAPHQISLDSFLRSKLTQLAQDNRVADEIRTSWSRSGTTDVLKMHVGPVASGAAVLADSGALVGIQAQHRKVIGVEMECYGLFAAAAESTIPQPKAFAIKSVCDFGDEHKDDNGQNYASFTSAQALKAFSERYL